MKTNNTHINSQKSKAMNVKSMLVAVLMSITMFAFAACNSASAITSENRTVANNFYGLILRSNAHVILSQGKDVSVRIEGDERNVSSIETSVENGALVINGKNETPVTIYVTINDISLIEVAGGGKIYGSQIINSDMLLLKVVGNGSINVDVRSLTLGMIVRGNGKIYVKGSTGDSFTRITGNGRVMAVNLDSYKAFIDVVSENEFSKKNNSGEAKHSALKIHY